MDKDMEEDVDSSEKLLETMNNDIEFGFFND